MSLIGPVVSEEMFENVDGQTDDGRRSDWYTIIALKASGSDCINNNELLHKIGVLQRYAMQLFEFTREILQANRWRSKYNGCTQMI